MKEYSGEEVLNYESAKNLANEVVFETVKGSDIQTQLYWLRKNIIKKMRERGYSVRVAKDFADRNASKMLEAGNIKLNEVL